MTFSLRDAAMECLKAAAFEERENKDRAAADFWRERAAVWFRRAVLPPVFGTIDVSRGPLFKENKT